MRVRVAMVVVCLALACGCTGKLGEGADSVTGGRGGPPNAPGVVIPLATPGEVGADPAPVTDPGVEPSAAVDPLHEAPELESPTGVNGDRPERDVPGLPAP